MKTIERLKQLLAKATPAPWTYKSQSLGYIAANEDGLTFFAVAYGVGCENADLVSETRNALPALLAVVEAAYEYVDRGSGRDDLIAALRALDGETT